MRQVKQMIEVLLVVTLRLTAGSLVTECCLWEEAGTSQGGSMHSCEVTGKEGQLTALPSRESVPVELIYSGDVEKDRDLLPLLQLISRLDGEDITVEPRYGVNRSISTLETEKQVANAYEQLCVYSLSLATGSFRFYLDFMSSWLSTGLRPSSPSCLQSLLLPHLFEHYLSSLPAPGLLIAGHYLSANISKQELLGQLCPPFISNQKSYSPRQLQEEECNPGCTANLYKSPQCYAVCNVSRCNYQKWTCACAIGCTPDYLSNDRCDSECNVKECYFDNYNCRKDYDYVPYTEQKPLATTESEWVKWMIVSLTLLATWYSLPSTFLGITIYCYIQRWKLRRNRHAITSNARLNLTASVAPMTSGQDLDFVPPGKIIELLGKRVFSREIVVYGDAMCVVCLAE